MVPARVDRRRGERSRSAPGAESERGDGGPEHSVCDDDRERHADQTSGAPRIFRTFPAVKVVWYTAMSMDGRIATSDGSLAFLELIGPGVERDFDEFVETIDAVVIGAATLRWLLDGGHGWPHDDLPTWLVTHDESLVERVGETRAPFMRREGDVAGVFGEVEAAGHERVWLAGGGHLAGQALAARRIDEVVATVAPTVVGAGPALFEAHGLRRNRFELVEARDLGGDAARLTWRVGVPRS
jgi:riboflavin biosynthesis pyrimidine reductase